MEFLKNLDVASIIAIVCAILLSLLVFGFLAGTLCDKKGESYGFGFLMGFFLGIIGLIYAAGLPVKNASEKNPIVKAHKNKDLCRCIDCANAIGKDKCAAYYKKPIEEEGVCPEFAEKPERARD